MHTRSRGAKTRSCSSPRCDELGCSARYSAFLLSRPFQYLTVRPRGRPFSTCFLLPPSSSLPPPPSSLSVVPLTRGVTRYILSLSHPLSLSLRSRGAYPRRVALPAALRLLSRRQNAISNQFKCKLKSSAAYKLFDSPSKNTASKDQTEDKTPERGWQRL